MALKFYSDINLKEQYTINDKIVWSNLLLSQMMPLAGGFNLIHIFSQNSVIDLDKLTTTGRYYSDAYDNNLILACYNNNNTALRYRVEQFVGYIIVEDAIGNVGTNLAHRHKRQTVYIRHNALGQERLDGCRVKLIRHMFADANGNFSWGDWQITVAPHVNGSDKIELPHLCLPTLDNQEVGASVKANTTSINANTTSINNIKTQTVANGGISDLKTRLESLGFNKGGKISVSINSGTSQDMGHIYKIGDVFYGKTFAIHFNKANTQIRTIIITITLPEGIAQNNVKSLMIFPPQILTTSKNTGGEYYRTESKLFTTMTQASYTFTYTNNYSPQSTFTTDVELSECIILGTTNINHALPSEYNAGSGSGGSGSGGGGGVGPNFGTMVELK